MTRALLLVGVVLLVSSAALAAEDECRCMSASECLDAARTRRITDLEGARPCYDRACTLGDANACRELADTVQWDRPDAAELELTIDAATRGCRRDHEQSCGILVSVFMIHDRPDVIAPAERVCAKGDALVCYELGYAWLERTKDAASWKKGRPLLERACRLGLAGGCTTLAARYQWGDDARRVAAAPAKARRYWWRACELGDVGACERGAQHDRGDEGVLMPRRAVPFLRRACESGRSAWSCAHLDDRRCEAGNERACASLEAAALKSCSRVCREWSSPPSHEGRTCVTWGSSCDYAFDRARAPLQTQLDDAVRACVAPLEKQLVTILAELVVLVTGRVRVERVRVLVSGRGDDKAAAMCIEKRLSAARTLEVPEKTTLRMQAYRRPRARPRARAPGSSRRAGTAPSWLRTRRRRKAPRSR